MKNFRLEECLLVDILPQLFVNPLLNIVDSKDKIWIAMSMLSRCHKYATDSLAVLEKESLVGVLGSREIIQSMCFESRSNLFEKTTVEVMSKNFHIVSSKSKFHDILKQMKNNRDGLLLSKNEFGSISAISQHNLIEIGMLYESSVKVDQIPSTEIITFNKNDTIDQILLLMYENHTDTLFLENSPLFINSKIIFEKIIADSTHSCNIDDVMKIKATTFTLNEATLISENGTIADMCKLMFVMKYPVLMTRSKILMPYDLLHVFN